MEIKKIKYFLALKLSWKKWDQKCWKEWEAVSNGMFFYAATTEMKPEFGVFHLSKNSMEDCTDWGKT